MGLHGRDAELKAVTHSVEAAAEGALRPLVVVGEAGIGKTALLDAGADAARAAGFVVLRGRAVEQERDLPFALAVAVLDDHAAGASAETSRALGVELAAVLPSAATTEERPAAGSGERFRYHRALRALLDDVAGDRPFALVLDDLQWADEASLEWVLHLLRRPPRAPGVLLLSTRQGESALRLVDAAREDGGHVTLAPLDDESARAVLDGVVEPQVAARIVAEAEGNPLFLRELARSAPDSGELPHTIVAAVQREASGLPAEARELLAGAAVADEPFDPVLAATAAGMAADTSGPALDLLVAADLIRPDTQAHAFRFRHPLVARAVYEAMPPATRIAAHERVAAELGRRAVPPALRAAHVERSARVGDDGAVQLLTQAAEQATATAPASAARWWGTALWLLGAEAAERRGPILLSMARALAAAGDPEAALEAFDQLEREGLPEAEEGAPFAARIERVLGRIAAATARLERALEHASHEARAELELEMAAVRFAAADVEGAIRHAHRAAAARPADDPVMRPILGAFSGFAAVWSGKAGPEVLEEAENLALRLPEDETEAAQWVAHACFECDRFARGAQLFARATSVRGARADHLLPEMRAICALCLFFDLRPGEALAQADAAEEGARLQGVPHQVAFAASARSVVLDLMGRAPEAEAAAEESLRLLASSEPTLVTSSSGALNRAVLHARDPERMLRELSALLGPERAGVERVTSLLQHVVRAAIAIGRPEEADSWVDRAELFAGRLLLPAGRVRTGTARAELLLAAGDADAARERAEEAVALADSSGLRQDGLRALVTLGRATSSRAVLERALSEATSAGAGALAAEAGRALRAIGGRPSASVLRAGGPAELSERERSIAELVARGQSNKEVAAALFLSAKTVENNLSRIYAKLGVRTRTDLARMLPPE